MRIPQRALRMVLTAGLLSTRVVQSRIERVGEFLGGVAAAGLDNEQLDRLTHVLYDRSRPSQGGGLFDWERDWFREDLPEAPARLLVGGAGSGREVLPLRERGYDIVAFDPAGSHVELCPGGLVGSFADLVNRDDTHKRGFLDFIESRAPYDGVILGWGSFTHVHPATLRLQVLTGVGRLTSGPVLLSFWTRAPLETQLSSARSFGERVGNLLGIQSGYDQRSDRVVSHAGFVHLFDKSELADLADRAGFVVSRWALDTGYPHITLASKVGTLI